MKPPARWPRATYRVQLHAGFTLHQLAEIVPYLHALGVSDIYASPLFRASPGSTHGYDVCDQNEINPEIGGIDALMKVSALLQERGMGLLVDFVPNHMGIEGPYNWRWLDVLEHGHYSRFAAYFDIQWNPRQASLHDRILVPMLHDFYGRVLEEGGIQLRYENSAFCVAYASLRFPLRPRSYHAILQRLAWFKNPGSAVAQKIETIGRRFTQLPRPPSVDSPEIAEQRARERDELRHELAALIESENLQADLDEVLKALNGHPGDPASFDNLHQILEEQFYRLAFWKSGTQEINYRRFFAVDTLVGLHMERPEVFDDTHRLLRDLITKGVVTGVRVDHIDGLWDPVGYLQKLAQLGRGEDDAPLYLLVEKILTEDERLPEDWAVHGTSGYDFAGQAIDLLLEPAHEPAFTQLYRDFTGLAAAPPELAYDLKLYIMEDLFPNAIENLAADLEAQVKSDRRWRDWTVNDLRLAISRIIACLSVYRTYRRAGRPLSLADIGVVERAVAFTLRRNATSDPAPFRFVRDLWIGRYPDAAASPEEKKWADDWVCRLQQYTGAIMAKSVEDTFFYRYVRLFAANEVGHDPARFGRPVQVFHDANAERLRVWPGAMLSTSTHDTKMSEDARARLMALAEIPTRWREALAQWSALTRDFKTRIGDRPAPNANEEYLFYQALLAAWPLDEKIDDTFRERLRDYLRKALSESKVNTTWSSPNEEWLTACDDFVAALLDPERGREFRAAFLPFARDLAERGFVFSLTQTVLKLTSPGVPDLYQGTDLWDFSLVDPDNRRPVDYATRIEALRSLEHASLDELVDSWRDGRIKLQVIRRILEHRRDFPALFAQGSYTPVEAASPNADRIVSFTRADGDRQLWVVALRQLGEAGNWRKAAAGVTLTPPLAGPWRDLLSGREWSELGQLEASAVLGALPVAVLACRRPERAEG